VNLTTGQHLAAGYGELVILVNNAANGGFGAE